MPFWALQGRGHRHPARVVSAPGGCYQGAAGSDPTIRLAGGRLAGYDQRRRHELSRRGVLVQKAARLRL